MAAKTPTVENNILTVTDPDRSGATINKFNIADPAEQKYWLEFLENEKAFRYVHTTENVF